ncbi:CPBP family intramembrane metalloprotease [Leuconostocaceae bacterium ESL0723]|nr:CPBP family intramembrane metalloprotease [Leuconostocaceae bacterium ESL0723]
MKKERSKKNRHYGILILIITLIGMLLEPSYPDELSLKGTIPLSLAMIAVLILVVWLVRKVTNKEKIFEPRLPLTRVELILALLLAAYFIGLYLANGNIQSLLGISNHSLNLVISSAVVALGAGFFEEYFVRGYLFNLTQRILNRYAVQKYRMTTIAIVTSLVFGLIHLGNLGQGDASMVTYQQVFYATCIGMVFCAIRVVVNRIWVTAIAHFLFDFSLDLTSNTTEADSWLKIIGVFSIVLILSLFLLILIDRSIKQNHIQELKP